MGETTPTAHQINRFIGNHETLEDYFKRCPRLTPGRHEEGVYALGGPDHIVLLPVERGSQIAADLMSPPLRWWQGWWDRLP